MRQRLSLLLVLPALWAGSAWSQTAPAAKAEDEFTKQTAIYKSVGEQRPEGYVIDRSLLSYAHILNDEFKQSIAVLGGNDRWLDIGAGEGRLIRLGRLVESG